MPRRPAGARARAGPSPCRTPRSPASGSGWADAAADAIAPDAAQHRARAHAGVAQPDGLLRQAQRARRSEDLHHQRGVMAHLPDAHRAGQRHQQALAAHENARRRAGRARSARRRAACGARRRRCRAGWRPRRAASPHRPAAPAARRRAGSARRRSPAGHLGAELASAFLACASTSRSRETTCVSTICAADAGGGVDRADHEADHVQPGHGQPAQPPRQRHAGHQDASVASPTM